jgi:cyanate permease
VGGDYLPRRRPRAFTVIGVLLLLGALLWLAVAVGCLLLPGLFNANFPEEMARQFARAFHVLLIFSALCLACSVLFGIGLLANRSWARRGALIFFVVQWLAAWAGLLRYGRHTDASFTLDAVGTFVVAALVLVVNGLPFLFLARTKAVFTRNG